MIWPVKFSIEKDTSTFLIICDTDILQRNRRGARNTTLRSSRASLGLGRCTTRIESSFSLRVELARAASFFCGLAAI